MDVLVIGGGGREHALVWKLKQSSKVKNIYVTPGNAGTAQIAENLSLTDKKEIIEWLKVHKVDLVVVGPDDYLAEGIVDDIQELCIAVFGPTKAAAQIEWSKSFAKQFMKEENIPTASSVTFQNISEAQAYIQAQEFPIVIKADGLALGKGVVIAGNQTEAEHALIELMEEKKYGNASATVVVEEFLRGKEISMHAFCDGTHISLFPTSQDHKRAYDGNMGPNTGGMGIIAPVPGISEKIIAEIKNTIIQPAVDGLRKRGTPFVGVLYPGIMITDDGPKVIEFNARFGDPETQPYMRLLDTDLLDILFACINGDLNETTLRWKEMYATCIVVASEGYPKTYKKGFSIIGLEEAKEKGGAIIFHAGTKNKKGEVVTNGGRVLGVTTTGTTLEKSLNSAYDVVSRISFKGMWFRKDIGSNSLSGGTKSIT